jgi:hypothetical protein
MDTRTLDDMATGATRAPTLWDQTGGPVSDAHPLTSHRAASKVRSGSQKAQALLALYAVWPDGGYTGYDLATSGQVVNGAGNPISANQMCTRLGELRDSGLVELKREFHGGPVVEAETTPGNTGQVHRLTAYGVTATVALAAADRRQVA